MFRERLGEELLKRSTKTGRVHPFPLPPSYGSASSWLNLTCSAQQELPQAPKLSPRRFVSAAVSELTHGMVFSLPNHVLGSMHTVLRYIKSADPCQGRGWRLGSSVLLPSMCYTVAKHVPKRGQSVPGRCQGCAKALPKAISSLFVAVPKLCQRLFLTGFRHGVCGPQTASFLARFWAFCARRAAAFEALIVSKVSFLVMVGSFSLSKR